MDPQRKIPGYQGYIPGKNNHVIGKRYTEAAARAMDCTAELRRKGNPNGMVELVDDRPQGRNFLYAQTAHGKQDEADGPQLCQLHVGRRRPLLNSAGVTDFRLMKTAVGGAAQPAPLTKTASLPALSYQQKKLAFHKVRSEELPEDYRFGEKTVCLPGYTGHKHGAQHVFAKSYGATTKLLSNSNTANSNTQEQSKTLLDYGETRPCGQALTEKHRIPGYQGYIPANHNHIYGKTYGEATKLAPMADQTMKDGGNASALSELVDNRPQGKINLYAQAANQNPPEPREPLTVHVSKGIVNVQYYEVGKDHKRHLKIADDTKEAMLGTHRVKGYTGHVHGSQHMYAASYGKVTRQLYGGRSNLTVPHTQDELLYYKDDRPHATYVQS